MARASTMQGVMQAVGGGPGCRTQRSRFFRALLLALLLAAPSSAVVGVIDDVPGATLLVPSFAVDLDACGSGDSRTTEVTVTNAGATDVVALLTVWTDLSVPVLDFNLHLPAGGSETVDLRALFCQGAIPQTGPAPASFVQCSLGALLPPPPTLPPTLQSHLIAATTGQPSPIVLAGACAGVDRGDRIARGYLTLDAVTDCTLQFPSDPGFSALLDMGNRLQGSVRLVDPDGGLDVTFPAVSLEADPLNLGFGDPTFYRRYNLDSSDAREPLPSEVTAPYRLEPGIDTRFFLWRDGLGATPFACASPPAPLADVALLIAADDAALDQSVFWPAPWEVGAFVAGDLGVDAAADGSSTGDITAALPSQSQAWLSSAEITVPLPAAPIPSLSLLGLVSMAAGLAAIALRRL